MFPTVETTMTSILQRLGRALSRRLRVRRVPVVYQPTAVDCGPAALAMIAAFHGRHVGVEECRDAIGAGRDGTSPAALALAARSIGLQPKYYVVTLAKLPEMSFPLIAHWDFNHYVVMESAGRHGARVVDPALGRRFVDKVELDRHFTGLVATFRPDASFVRLRTRAAARYASLLRLFASVPGVAALVAQLIVSSLVVQVFGLALPALTELVVDVVIPQQRTDVAGSVALAAACLLLSQGTVSVLRASIITRLSARLDTRFMLTLVRHLLSLPLRFFQVRTTGDLLTRLGSNVVLREALAGRSVSAVIDGLLVLVYVALLALRAPLFAVVTAGLGAIQVALLLGTTGRVHRLMHEGIAAQSTSQNYVAEALLGIASLKSSGAEERALHHWTALLTAHMNALVKRNQLLAVVDAVLLTVRTLAPLVLLGAGARAVLRSEMTLGQMLAASALAGATLPPLASLAANLQQLQLVGAHAQRLVDLLDARPEQPDADGKLSQRVSGRIEVRDVTFSYAAASRPVLRHISLEVLAGQKIAIVGRSGSGKSTLAMLLLGLHEPTSGDIFFDGVSLRDHAYVSLRAQFGAVLQEASLFSGTIRDNIAFNDPSLSLADVTAAAKLAAVHDEIAAMPMAYGTPLVGTAGSLSGGQRQRVAIARALAPRPRVLLLDEATSHLDTVTEHALERNLRALSCTRIVIAHRLSTVRDADVIVVMADGEIVERGSHAELVSAGGAYAALVRAQVVEEPGEPYLVQGAAS